MIEVVNLSTVLPKDQEESVLVPICAAIEKQLAEHVAAPWSAHPWKVRYAATAPDFTNPEDYWNLVAYIVDDDPNVPGALAYHEDPAGVPDIKVLAKTILDNGGTWSSGPNSVSVALSHEVIETLGDPQCSFEAATADGSQAYARELCDPVENDSYDIDGVAVSNFVLPSWFDGANTADDQRDWLGKLTQPFTLDAGGYAIVTAQGQPTQVTGQIPADHGSRAQRRGVVLPAGHPFKKE